MIIGKVIGTVVSTKKESSLKGYKILIVQPLTFDLKEDGEPILAVDTLNTGEGEIVLLARGRESTFPLEPDPPAIDRSIVGKIDTIYYDADA